MRSLDDLPFVRMRPIPDCDRDGHYFRDGGKCVYCDKRPNKGPINVGR
jgi:hypothetical protein